MQFCDRPAAKRNHSACYSRSVLEALEKAYSFAIKLTPYGTGLSLRSRAQVPIFQGFAWGMQRPWADGARQEDPEELETCSLFVHTLTD